jgi:integrase
MVTKTGNVTELDRPEAPPEALATPREEAKLRHFLDSLRAQGRRPATIGAYESDWRRLAEWSRRVNGEPFDLSRMVGREAAEFRSYCLRLGHAPATVNRRLVFLAEYARWPASVGEVPVSLADEMAKVPRVPRQVLAPRSLPRHELRRFLKEVDLRAGVRDKALVYLLLYTGLRLGEAARLKLGDVALSPRKGTVRVRSESAKGGKERLVPVPLTARRMLAEYLALRGTGRGRSSWASAGPWDTMASPGSSESTRGRPA